MKILLTIQILSAINAYRDSQTGYDIVDENFLSFEKFMRANYNNTKNSKKVMQKIRRTREILIRPFNAVVRFILRNYLYVFPQGKKIQFEKI